MYVSVVRYIIIQSLVLLGYELIAQAPPPCGQDSTLVKIVECQNCTILVDSTRGTLMGDTTALRVEANSSGPIAVRLRYKYFWHDGVKNNWIHGVSFDASSNWQSKEVTTPSGWKYMPNGVAGCCSRKKYGPGYFYDGEYRSSCRYPGVCLDTDTDIVSVIPNDSRPSNNWGFPCSDDCPEFDYFLTYCPSNNDKEVTEIITFKSSADGESGSYWQNADCDNSNVIIIVIDNSRVSSADFTGIKDTYCNESVNLTYDTYYYDSGYNSIKHAWFGAVVDTTDERNAVFNYCDNMDSTYLAHIVGADKCYDGPDTIQFNVWTPEITSVSGMPLEACGAFTPDLDAEIRVRQTGELWQGSGEIEWLEDGKVVSDFEVIPKNCGPNSRTFVPKFNTGCEMCNVLGPPVTITAHPRYTTSVLSTAFCGAAYAKLIGNDGTTICDELMLECTDHGEEKSTSYRFEKNQGSCTFIEEGKLSCRCTVCMADGGQISLDEKVFCPQEKIYPTLTGQNNGVDYNTLILVVDGDRIVEISEDGSITVPMECSEYSLYAYNYGLFGSAPPNPYKLSEIDCTTDCCDLSDPFKIQVESSLIVDCPTPVSVPSCSSVEEVQAMYAAWKAGFTYSGACGSLIDNFQDFPELPASLICGEGASLVFEYSVDDACNWGPVTCSSTFEVEPGMGSLQVSCPGAVSIAACSAKSEIEHAYTIWKSEFRSEGGCGDIRVSYETPELPDYICGDPVDIMYTYEVIDACGHRQSCLTTFKILAGANENLTAICPDPVVLSECTSENEVRLAYQGWKAEFSTYGGCGAFVESPDPPDMPAFPFESVVYVDHGMDVKDKCGDFSSCTSSFTVEYDTMGIIDPDTLYCDVDHIVLKAWTTLDEDRATYKWIDHKDQYIPGATSPQYSVYNPGMYGVKILDTRTGCTKIDTVEVLENRLSPSVSVDDDYLLCDPDSIRLVPVIDEGPYTVRWKDSQGKLLEFSHEDYSMTTFTDGWYSVEVENEINSCVIIDTVYVFPPEYPEFELEYGNVGCLSYGDGFIKVIPKRSAKSWEIMLNDVPMVDSLHFVDLNEGNYSVVVKNSGGCISRDTIELGKDAIFAIDLENHLTAFYGEEKNLVANLELDDSNIDSIYWEPADLVSCVDCLSTDIFPKESGVYNVTVVDVNGCKMSASVSVHVNRQVEIFIPNTFSPNSDGRNDRFSIFTRRPDVFETLEFLIFDRWGNKIYHSESIDYNNPEWGWDGLYKDVPVPTGVYRYLLSYRIEKDDPIILSGDVTVLR